MSLVMKTRNAFTLVELMIVVAIVGILGSIGLPGYFEFVQRGKVQEATSALSTLKLKSEQFFGERRTYLDFDTTNLYTSLQGTSKYFNLNCAIGPDPFDTFTCTMTGINDMAGYIYSVDEAGNKASSIDGVVYACWVKKKGDAC